MYKGFEVVHVGPIRLYFNHFELIGFESDKTKIVVCGGETPVSRDQVAHNEPRLQLEADPAKWVSTSEFSEKWTELCAACFK
jgi:hypothetical protein